MPNTRYFERSSILPLDGHRGALYLGDLIAVIARSCVRPEWRWAFHPTVTRPYWTVIPPDTIGIYVGVDELSTRPRLPGQGCFGAAKHGMIPEFTIVAEPDDPDSEVICTGWRQMLSNFLMNHAIHPTEEVLKLYGPVSYMQLYYRPEGAISYVPVVG